MRHRFALSFALALIALPLAAEPGFWRQEWPGTDFSRSQVDDWA